METDFVFLDFYLKYNTCTEHLLNVITQLLYHDSTADVIYLYLVYNRILGHLLFYSKEPDTGIRFR